MEDYKNPQITYKEIDTSIEKNQCSKRKRKCSAYDTHLFPDYIIFITEKYKKNKRIFLCLSKPSLHSKLEKYNIKNEDHKDRSIYYKDDSYAFNDGEILPNVIYKKMELGAKNIYFPIETYPIKQILYKIRSFIQVCETLGAKKIHIKYNKISSKTLNLNQDMNLLAGAFKMQSMTDKSDEKDIVTTLHYDKSVFSSQMCLNVNDFEKYLEDNNSHFLISVKDYNTDINLRYLVRSRLFSNLQKYSTTFTMNQHSTIDFSLMSTLNDYGLSMKINKKKSSSLIIDITVEFHEFEDIIGSDNAPLDEVGFKWIRRRFYKHINDKGETNSRPIVAFIRRLCIEKDQKALTGEFNQYAKKLYLYETFHGTQNLLNKAVHLHYWVDINKFLDILMYFDPLDIVELNESGLNRIYHLGDYLPEEDKLEYLEKFISLIAKRRDLKTEYEKYIQHLKDENNLSELLHIWDWSSLEALITMLKNASIKNTSKFSTQYFNLFGFYNNLKKNNDSSRRNNDDTPESSKRGIFF